MKRLLEYLPLMSFAALAYLGIWITHKENIPLRWKETPKYLAPPPEYIEQMQFGFSGSVADSLWLRWIQDADICFSYDGQGVVQPTFSEPTIAQRMDRFFNPRYKNCDNSWGFKMLDAVTKLDPRFKMPYTSGTMALSVLVEDYVGASVLFERGLVAYPNDWQLNYRAAYHFLFDKQDNLRAAQLLSHAAEVGGPSWLKSLAARLYSRSGQLELGISSLIEFRKAYKEGDRGLIELDKRIAELKHQLEAEQRKTK